MRFSFCNGELADLDVDLLAVLVFEEQHAEGPELRSLDRRFEAGLTRLLNEEKFEGKTKQTALIHTHGIIQPRRLLFVGLGKREEFEVPDTRQAGALIIQGAEKVHATSIASTLPPFDATAAERATGFLAEGMLASDYRYERFRAEKERRTGRVEQVQIVLAGENLPHLAVSRAEIVGRAVCLTRDLVNEPPGELTPTKLAEVAQDMASKSGLDCKVLGPKECEKQNMRLFLAVARGSVEEPRFIHLTYRPRGKEKPSRRVVLVGKGVTFDSGGLSLKPSASMVDMKADMAGAATVLSVMGALSSLGIKAEVHALIAATENMPSGDAYKLGDVIVGKGGHSVEITNTDAEGRLTLADALTYAAKLQPDEIVDVATLTGACVVALGPHMAGVMGNDTAFIERLMGSARRVGEEVWALPLPKRLKEQLKSTVADLKNAGDRWGGALTAGLFLKEFVDHTPWIHLDIAGPAYSEKAWFHVPEGGTGFGVATLLEYIGSRS